MAFKLPQGRAPFLQTGRDIPSSMMSGSAMKQTTTTSPKTDIELTVEYERGKKKMAEARKDEEKKKGIEGQQGITIDAPTGTATPNLPMHTVERAGSFLREYDSKRGVVNEVPWNDMSSTGGEAAEKLKQAVERRNADVTRRQTKNANLYNVTGGGTAPENLSGEQKQLLVKLGKAKVVPAQQKKPPMKQVAKGAFKKTSMTSTGTKTSKPAAPKQMKKKSC